MAPTPERAKTLVDVLRAHAQAHPERHLYGRLEDGEVRQWITYGEIDRRARSIAAWLSEHASPGDRAMLLYPHSLEYPTVFQGCLYAGVAAVPAFPPDLKRATQTLPRVLRILRDSRPKVVLTTAGLADTVREVFDREVPEDQRPELLVTDDIGDERADAWREPPALEREIAFLQYTSGSTRQPRGVVVGHDNLYAHQRLAHRVFRRHAEETTVSWLPFYHDMGLIGGLLYPLYTGGTCLLMPPTGFLRRPLAWLRAISDHRAAVSTGPDFAYAMCASRASDEDVAGLDLSTWRLTVCGAEPLQPETLSAFTERFAPAGFRPETFLPCWGMAEATLLASGCDADKVPKTVWFDSEALRRGEVKEVAEDTPGARPLIGCGEAMDEHEVRVVDLDARRPLPPERVGELWLRGPAVGRTYWSGDDHDHDRFTAQVEGVGGFLRTDDTGFIHEGQLFVTGRVPDLLRVAGRLHQPQDLERSAREAHSKLARSECAALMLGDEALIVVETRRSPAALHPELATAVQSTLERDHGLLLRVVLMPPRSVAKTTSGKVRRHAYKAALEGSDREILFDLPAEPAKGAADLL